MNSSKGVYSFSKQNKKALKNKSSTDLCKRILIYLIYLGMLFADINIVFFFSFKLICGHQEQITAIEIINPVHQFKMNMLKLFFPEICL